jgi:hypothetical protein
MYALRRYWRVAARLRLSKEQRPRNRPALVAKKPRLTYEPSLSLIARYICRALFGSMMCDTPRPRQR